jgi:hypothetical protein
MTNAPSDLTEFDTIQLKIAAEISTKNTAPDTIDPVTPEDLNSPPPTSELLDTDTSTN